MINKNADTLAIDIETYDPNLEKLGPGVYRNDGYILGVSISDGVNSEYYSLRHYDTLEKERQKNKEIIKEILALDNIKIGANLMYDVDWLENWGGIKVNGKLYDIQIAEALIDENQGHYSLDYISKKYLGVGKTSALPEKFCIENNLKGDFRAHLYRMPYILVKDYAIGDVEEPIKIMTIQKKILEKEELFELFELECNLIRCLILMRKTGTKIDTNKRDRNAFKVQCDIETREQALFSQEGEFNYNSSPQVALIFDKYGIPYETTKKGNPSIDANYLKLIREEHKIADDIFELRKAKKHLDTFLMGSYVRYVGENNLIHCSFYNTRTDEFGTRSGRFSSANPNLQQIPSKGVDEYWGQVCREVFIPFEDCWWGKIDYSQIEYRFMAHFAIGEGSAEIRNAYNNNPDQDYHQYIMDLTGLKRRYAKNLNFGVAFGMGAQHMADLFQWTIDYAYEVLDIYHSKAPYIKSTIKEVEKVATKRGYIKTFLKRRSHLLDKRKAYTMYCRLVQGSAADLMKKAMSVNYNSGVYDILYPHLTVHDELDVSIPKTKIGIEAYKEMKHQMETCLILKVPIKAEAEVGDNWADISEEKAKEIMEYYPL